MNEEMQKVFDRVVLHLLRQGERSAMPFSAFCKYRGPRGLKCAVGFLIADEHYSPALENRTADYPAVREALRKSGVDADDGEVLQLLGCLQAVHDDYAPHSWLNELKKLATRFGLDMPALTGEMTVEVRDGRNEESAGVLGARQVGANGAADADTALEHGEVAT